MKDMPPFMKLSMEEFKSIHARADHWAGVFVDAFKAGELDAGNVKYVSKWFAAMMIESKMSEPDEG